MTQEYDEYMESLHELQTALLELAAQGEDIKAKLFQLKENGNLIAERMNELNKNDPDYQPIKKI